MKKEIAGLLGFRIACFLDMAMQKNTAHRRDKAALVILLLVVSFLVSVPLAWAAKLDVIFVWLFFFVLYGVYAVLPGLWNRATRGITPETRELLRDAFVYSLVMAVCVGPGFIFLGPGFIWLLDRFVHADEWADYVLPAGLTGGIVGFIGRWIWLTLPLDLRTGLLKAIIFVIGIVLFMASWVLPRFFLQ